MSIEKIKELRQRSGAGFADVKNALEASDYDMEKAINWLRVNGIAKAAKKSDRIAAEGSVFIIKNDKKAVLIEINSETDFVASNEKFVSGSTKIAETILSSNIESGDIKEALLLKVENETIESLLINMTAIIGEKISLRRFVSFEGNTGIYKHANSRIGVMVSGEGIEEEVLRDVAMHVAAMKPEFLSKEDISEEILTSETKLAEKELASQLEGKPENIQKNIIAGKVNKVLSESVLLEQTFVKDSSKKVKDLALKGSFTKFVRYEVGEGIEKTEVDFAAEVAEQIKINK